MSLAELKDMKKGNYKMDITFLKILCCFLPFIIIGALTSDLPFHDDFFIKILRNTSED